MNRLFCFPNYLGGRELKRGGGGLFKTNTAVPIWQTQVYTLSQKKYPSTLRAISTKATLLAILPVGSTEVRVMP